MIRLRASQISMRTATATNPMGQITIALGAFALLICGFASHLFATSSSRADDPAPPQVALPEDRRHPHAKILNISRDTDGKVIVHLDKGSEAKLKAGMKGFILQGREGDTILEGGEFTITEVLDDDHCVAKTSLRRIGKNNRCVIYTVVD
jgi:hypothetical protein